MSAEMAFTKWFSKMLAEMAGIHCFVDAQGKYFQGDNF
jgi:hypothetical protein